MGEKERQLHRHDMADVYIATAERHEHSAIFVHAKPNTPEELIHLAEVLRRKSGDRYFLMAHGGVTYGIPEG